MTRCLLLSIRYFPDVAVDHMSQDLMTFLLTSICTTHYFKNPYLMTSGQFMNKLQQHRLSNTTKQLNVDKNDCY